MKPPRLNRVAPDTQGIALGLNQFASDVISLATNGITFGENISCDVIDAEYLSTVLPMYVSLRVLTTTPAGIVVLRAQQVGGDGTFVSGCQVTWGMAGPLVKITAISGLSVATKYSVKLALIAG